MVREWVLKAVGLEESMQQHIKDRDPAEGARENVNVPVDTDEAAPGDTAQRPAGGRVEHPNAEERDRDTQAPRGNKRQKRTTI
jgi:hypothetical protein